MDAKKGKTSKESTPIKVWVTPEEKAAIAAKADDIVIVVAGGVGRKGAYVPTWSGGTRAVSRTIPV